MPKFMTLDRRWPLSASMQQRARRVLAGPDVAAYVGIADSARRAMWQPEAQPANPLSLRCALIGPPNAGKSTLLNGLVQAKVSAASSKRHTTRAPTTGVLTVGRGQLVLVDTPGLTEAASGREALRAQASTPLVLEGCDAALIVLDAARRLEQPQLDLIRHSVDMCVDADTEPLLVFAKADLLAKDPVMLAGKFDVAVDAFEAQLVARGRLDTRGLDASPLPRATVVAAERGDADPRLAALRRTLFRMAVPRDWAFSSSARSDRSPLEMAGEVLREKLFRVLQDEVPYETVAEIRSWSELDGGAVVVIHADVLTESRGHAAMLTARGGSPVRAAARAAERDLSELFRQRVRVFLHVTVSPRRLSVLRRQSDDL